VLKAPSEGVSFRRCDDRPRCKCLLPPRVFNKPSKLCSGLRQNNLSLLLQIECVFQDSPCKDVKRIPPVILINPLMFHMYKDWYVQWFRQKKPPVDRLLGLSSGGRVCCNGGVERLQKYLQLLDSAFCLIHA
jgi:hypothetical protein